jgi:hypothetical protein
MAEEQRLREAARRHSAAVVAVAALALVIGACSSTSKTTNAASASSSSGATASSISSPPSTSAASTSESELATGPALAATGALEGTVDLGTGFASCAAVPCEGAVTIDGEIGKLTVTNASVHLTMGEDEFEGDGVTSGKVSVPRAGTLTFTRLTLIGQGVAEGEEVILDGTASA